VQGDAVHAEQALTASERVKALTQRASRIQALRDQVREELDARCQEIDKLSVRIDVLAKVNELFRALMDKLVMSHVRSVEHVITEGLRSIFFDQMLTFEAEIATRRDRICIDFYIRQERGSHVVRGRPLSNFGGGPATIASFVLRLLVLMKLKRAPMLFLDETLSAMSPEYIDQTGLFLKKLAATTGTPILLVTHKHEFIDQATVAYAATELTPEAQVPHLGIQRLRGGTS
jgi:DNA repair exonuclease SbcCD ATPase subunit